MCRIYSYFWETCSHVTHEFRRCNEARNHGPMDILPTISTEINELCPKCTRNPRNRPRRSRSQTRRNGEARTRFLAQQTRQERDEAVRQAVEVIEARDESIDRDLRHEERTLMNIPVEQLTFTQAHRLRTLFRRLTYSESERRARLERFIERIPNRLLPGGHLTAIPDNDGADTRLTTFIASLADNPAEEVLTYQLSRVQEYRRIDHGQRPYLRRHRRVAAICRLLEPVTDLGPFDSRCNICLLEMLDRPGAESPVRLPACRHIFGNACIQAWLTNNTSCPVCRRSYNTELTSARNQRPVSENEGAAFLENYAEAVARDEVMQNEAEAHEAAERIAYRAAREVEAAAREARAAEDAAAALPDEGFLILDVEELERRRTEATADALRRRNEERAAATRRRAEAREAPRAPAPVYTLTTTFGNPNEPPTSSYGHLNLEGEPLSFRMRELVWERASRSHRELLAEVQEIIAAERAREAAVPFVPLFPDMFEDLQPALVREDAVLAEQDVAPVAPMNIAPPAPSVEDDPEPELPENNALPEAEELEIEGF